MKAAELQATIGALDLVTIEHSPTRWRAPIEKLQLALAAAEHVQRRLRLVGPGIAIAAFFLFEGARLSPTEWGLAAAIGAGIVAAVFTRRPELRALSGGLATIASFALHLIHGLANYIVLGMLISIAINYALEKIYPALGDRDRINALRRHFLPSHPEPIDDDAA